MKKILWTFMVAMAVLPATSRAVVLISTGWDSPTSTSTDAVATNGTANTVAITGAGSNAASPANFWSVSNAAQVDLSTVTYISNGTNNVGAASGNDILRKGAIFTTGTDFGYTIGVNNSQIRYANNSPTNTVWAPQLNSAAVNDARFNMIFEIKSGFSFDNWNVAFNYGTASTTGGWNNNTALQNGTADVDIYSVAGDGTLTLTGLTFTGTSLAGTGPLASLSADNALTSLGAGNYLLSIALTGKTQTQRYTIDNFVLSGAAVVPEPSTWALLVLGSAALVVLRRRS